MIYTTIFNIGGRKYLLDLDTEKADRNYEDEDYMEWFVTFPDGIVLDITMGKLAAYPQVHEASLEIYNSMGAFEDDQPTEARIISLKAKS